MKLSVIFSALIFLLMCSTASAQTDWISRFLDRYASSLAVDLSRSISEPPVSLAAMVQNSAISLTTEDVIRLLLENNQDVAVSRGIPISSFYAVESLFRPFEPNFHVSGALTYNNSPSSNVLAGAASLVELTHDYKVGFGHTLQTGTSYSVDFEFNRFSSNSVFHVYNPAYNGSVKYGITQHVLRDFGRRVNSRQIRIARNNEKISELQFELQIIDSVTQALQSYWDLVFAAEDAKVKQRSLDLAKKTLHDNQVQVQVGTLASIDLVQAESEVATRYEDLVTAQYNIDQLQDQMKKMISSETDPGVLLARLDLTEPVREPKSETLLPLRQAIEFALESRRELKQADYEIDNQDINIQYAENQQLPKQVTSGN